MEENGERLEKEALDRADIVEKCIEVIMSEPRVPGEFQILLRDEIRRKAESWTSP